MEDPRAASAPGASTCRRPESPLRACFGVACPVHGRCVRYAAVALSPADPHTMVTCQRGTDFPLFLEAADAPAANDETARRAPPEPAPR